MPEVSVEDFRGTCGSWDEEMGCLDDYPGECPIHGECQKEAESTDEEPVPA